MKDDFPILNSTLHLLFQIHSQYQELYQRAKDQTKVYAIDLDASDNMSALSLAVEHGLPMTIFTMLLSQVIEPLPAIGVGLALSFYQSLNGFNNPNTFPSLNSLNNLQNNLIPTPLTAFRDAIAAKKTAEYLVPKHQHEDGSKVNVGILYGASHSGIETKLKHPWIADATLWMYHDLFRYGDTKRLNEVREIIPGEEEFRRYDCELFK